MKWKPDWTEAAERLTALWRGEPVDRTCIAIRTPRAGGIARPPRPPTAEARWLDPDWLRQDLRATLANTWWGGEAVPSYLVMSGWVVSAGGRPDFSSDTIWFEPQAVECRGPSPFTIAADDPWVAKHRRAYLAVAEEAMGDAFMVGHPCLLPASDLLSMHMGTDRFLLALMDHPAWMASTLLEAGRQVRQEGQALNQAVRAFTRHWYGNPGWMPFWAPEPFSGTQSDVSCMLSPVQFDQFVLPELDLISRENGAVWYHLDGRDAKQHLPRLLSLPYLRVLQYTPTPAEPPNGPEHLEFYRAVQAAGKIVHISLPPANVEPLVRSLDRRFLMLDTYCGSVQEGEELLAAVRRWT